MTKPRFKLRRSRIDVRGRRWLAWEMVSGTPFYSEELNNAIIAGSIVTMPAESFWKLK